MKLNVLNPRNALCRAALLGALFLTRVARRLASPSQPAHVSERPAAAGSLNPATAFASGEPRPSGPARRVRLDIPFFVESKAEIKITDATRPLKTKPGSAWPRANAINELLQFRYRANRKRAWSITGAAFVLCAAFWSQSCSAGVLTWTSAPNVSYHIKANTNLATTNWVSLGTVPANNVRSLLWTDSQAGLYPVRFYRFVYP